MKNSLKVLSVAALAAPASLFGQFALDDATVTVEFAFESEYSFRGVKLAGPSIQPSILYEVQGFYAEIWSSSDVRSGSGESGEVDYTVGYSWDIDAITADVGFTYYSLTGATDTQEIYVGAALNLDELLVDPSLYLYYDFELENTTLEGSLDYAVGITEFIGVDADLELGAFVGHVWVDQGNDYFYYGVTADVVFAFTDAAYGSVGVRYAGNDEDINPDDQLWWGAAVGVSF
ncbi:MAG: hypothetical protein JJT75_00155 [Opitutales bacterium]|nr:hypothetical protein [Opitutales bacterium]MCH8540192.1 TorF family putative porin [Opitutales bacterium]